MVGRVPGQERRLQACLVLFFCLLYLLTANGRLVNRDAEAIFQVACSLVGQGSFAVPAASVFTEAVGPRGTGGDSLSFATETARIGLDGRAYSMYGLGQSLAAVPLCAASAALQPLVHVDPYVFSRLSASLLNSAVTAATVLLLYRMGRMLGYSVRAALLVAFVYGVSTMAWPYAKSFAGEPLTGVSLLLGLYALERAMIRPGNGRGRWLALSGAAYGGALLVRISASIALPVALFYLLWRSVASQRQPGARQSWTELARCVTSWSAPVVAAVMVVALYNLVRFGDALNTGYQSIAWNVPPQVGLYGLLLSPGKGMLWYNPPLVASIVGLTVMLLRRRPAAYYIAGVTLVWIGFHSPYRFWEGGWSWGPRLLLPVLPALILPLGDLLSPETGRAEAATRATRKWGPVTRHLGHRALMLLAVAGILIQVAAVGADYTRYLWANSLEHADDAYQRVVYDPAGSPLLWQPVALIEVTGNVTQPGRLDRLRQEVVERARQHAAAGLEGDALSVAVLDDTAVVGLNVPDFWFILLPIFGADAAAVAVVVGLLVLALAASGVGLARQLRAMDTPAMTARRVAA